MTNRELNYIDFFINYLQEHRERGDYCIIHIKEDLDIKITDIGLNKFYNDSEYKVEIKNEVLYIQHLTEVEEYIKKIKIENNIY